MSHIQKHNINTVSRIAALICLTGAASLVNAAFSFDPAVHSAVGNRPSGIATGDFNGDGMVDVATTSGNPDTIDILLNDGSGVVSLAIQVFLPGGSSPQDILAGDLDGDGDMDLAVALRDTQSLVTVYNMGGGAFVMGPSAPTGDRPRGMDMADIDGDEDLDIALANRNGDSVTVFVNDGSGNFSSATFAVGGEPRQVALGDFDNDGDADLAVTEHDDRSVRIMMNNGNSYSTSAVLSVGPLVRPEGIEAADLDGDGDMDIVATTDDATLNIHQVSVFINGGGFSGPFNYAVTGSNPGSVVAADLDCDGDLDLATANSDSANVTILTNMGGAVFGDPMTMGAGAHPDSIRAADLDGDSDAELIVANRDSNSVSVITNQTCSGPGIPGDLDGDGDVDQSDLGILLASYLQNDGGDIDGDGDTDQSDLGILLANYTG